MRSQFLKICFSALFVVCCFIHPAFSENNLQAMVGQSFLKERIEKERFKKEILALLESENFDELERLADEYRASESKFSTGGWELEYFYKGLCEGIENKDMYDANQHLSLLEKWGKAKEGSVTQKIALADAYNALAWNYRGDGYAYSVAQDVSQKFAENVKKSWDILEGMMSSQIRDPHFYALAISVGKNVGISKEKIYEILMQGSQNSLLYEPLYRRMATVLLPRWYGEPGEVEKFADWAVEITKDQAGEEMYVYIADKVREYELSDLFENYHFSWPRLKEGFLSLRKKYPDSFYILNAFTWFACYAKDKELARMLFSEIGNNWDQYSVDIWGDKEFFNKWRQWVLR